MTDTEKLVEPVAGVTYKDDLGRQLEVKEVFKADPLGRDVRGLVTDPRHDGSGLGAARYTCDLLTFPKVWRPL
jgi:hypothetical protein